MKALKRKIVNRLSRHRMRYQVIRHQEASAREESVERSIFEQVADYWTGHNVTQHKQFSSREESLEYFRWRCDQYPGYLDLMPVAGFDGKNVLDFGCGPGHDLVGFREHSKCARLVGADVSEVSLAEAKARLELHGDSAELLLLEPVVHRLPFADGTFDYIHSSGVLHHVPNLPEVLGEFRRVLEPGGKIRVMVYNYDSIWMHLYVAYILRFQEGSIPLELPIREAFARSTDGPRCPIANCYTTEEFAAIAAQAGLNTRRVGVAVSLDETKRALRELHQACKEEQLARVHREFLLEVTFDDKLRPFYRGVPAGIDLVLELEPR